MGLNAVAGLDTSKSKDGQLFAALAVAGGAKTTWHKYGQEILATDSIAEIAKKAGLDYKVVQRPVSFTGLDGKTYKVEGSVANVRTDTNDCLGVVGEDYKVVQPIECVEFFREFMRKNKMTMETAGALHGGRIVWAMAKLGKDFDFLLPGGDKVIGYGRLQTAFGTGKYARATAFVATSTRQVCENTEELVTTDEQRNGYRVSHSQVFDAKALQQAVGLLGQQHKVTAQFWNALCARKVTVAERDKFFCDLFGIDVKERDAVDSTGKQIVSTRTRNMLAQLASAYDNGPGSDLKSAKGTAYGLLQAVTYWVDHQATSIDKGDGKDKARQASSWFGLGSRTRKDAEFLAAELAGCSELIAA
jgi:phage/plasmid-like protein (TIGR03299 family)